MEHMDRLSKVIYCCASKSTPIDDVRRRFHELFNRWSITGETFSAEDYMAPTPSYAVFGSSERGFDPVETRVRRRQAPPAHVDVS